MLFFLMLGLFLSLGLVVSIPFHFELSLIATTLLGYDEAYGSYRMYTFYLVPLLNRIKHILSPSKSEEMSSLAVAETPTTQECGVQCTSPIS